MREKLIRHAFAFAEATQRVGDALNLLAARREYKIVPAAKRLVEVSNDRGLCWNEPFFFGFAGFPIRDQVSRYPSNL